MQEIHSTTAHSSLCTFSHLYPTCLQGSRRMGCEHVGHKVNLVGTQTCIHKLSPLRIFLPLQFFHLQIMSRRQSPPGAKMSLRPQTLTQLHLQQMENSPWLRAFKKQQYQLEFNNVSYLLYFYGYFLFFIHFRDKSFFSRNTFLRSDLFKEKL